MDSSVNYNSCNINQFDMQISNSFMDCRIFWVRVVSSESESLATKYTRHSFFELQYALQEPIALELEDRGRIDVRESEFVVVPPNTGHQITESGAGGARFIIAFSPEFRDAQLRSAAGVLERIRVLPETEHMRGLLSVMLRKGNQDTPIRRESITALVECFLLEVMETVFADAKDAPQSLTGTQREVQRMLAFIRDCNGIGISVADVANRFMLSPRQVTRMFTAVTGAGPSTANALEKLKRVEELIVSTQLTFLEIAEVCGFSDGYALNKFFKRHNHVNLSEFRELSRKNKKALP